MVMKLLILQWSCQMSEVHAWLHIKITWMNLSSFSESYDRLLVLVHPRVKWHIKWHLKFLCAWNFRVLSWQSFGLYQYLLWLEVSAYWLYSYTSLKWIFHLCLSQIHRPPEFILFLNPQKSMGGSVKDQRPVSIKLHAKYPIDYPDR